MKPFQIIDLHCDTIVECVTNGADFRSGTGHISLDKLAAGGSLAQCFAIWIPTGKAAERHHTAGVGYYDYYKTAKAFFKKAMAENSDVVRQARTVAEIEQNKADGKLSAILTVEDSIFVEGKMERIDEMKEDGVRMASLIWNNENCMGYPNRRDFTEHMMGLKPFGYDAIAKMNEYGIVVDVSHLNEGGFWGVAKTSKKPFAASHSCARALCDHPRNLTDEQLKALGEAGVEHCCDSAVFLAQAGAERFLREEAHGWYIVSICEFFKSSFRLRSRINREQQQARLVLLQRFLDGKRTGGHAPRPLCHAQEIDHALLVHACFSEDAGAASSAASAS